MSSEPAPDITVDEFLAHYGIPGMKWGKRKSRDSSTPRPKMSREKKIAIAVGIGTTVAIGAAVTASLLTKGSIAEVPVHTIVQTATTNRTMMAGKANLIFNAASMAANSPTPAVPRTIKDQAKEQVFNTVKSAALNKVKDMSYSDFKSMIDSTPPVQTGLIGKAKGAVTNKAKEISINAIRDFSTAKAAEIANSKTKR